MGLTKLHSIVAAIKDTAAMSLSRPASSSSSSSSFFPPSSPPPSTAHLAVLRATPPRPPTAPPPPDAVTFLLSFGRGSRVTASALASALCCRISDRSPPVTLKALLCLHFLLTRGSFIITDQLLLHLHRHPQSGRNPLALQFHPSPFVRFLSRIVELLLITLHISNRSTDRLSGLLTPDLASELLSFATLAAEIRRLPPLLNDKDQLLQEVVRVAQEEWAAAQKEISARVAEARERMRVGYVGFADAVELGFALRRVEEEGTRLDCEWMVWDRRVQREIREARKEVETVLIKEREVEARKVKRENASASARVAVGRSLSGSGDFRRVTRLASSRMTGRSNFG